MTSKELHEQIARLREYQYSQDKKHGLTTDESERNFLYSYASLLSTYALLRYAEAIEKNGVK